MTTALAIRPKEQALEFRRCTGHCCDPIKLWGEKIYFSLQAALGSQDASWILQHCDYHGEFPPGSGLHIWSCHHFDRETLRCTIYGTGQRCNMCRRHPEYELGPWQLCSEPGCTRRTVVIGMDQLPLRWRFPDLWTEDYNRWHAWESRVCLPEYGPECMPEGAER